MEEKQTVGASGAPLYKPSAKAKLENYWYHYKWHSIAAVFVIIAILVCSLQMCAKDSYDAYVLYAGDYEVKRTTEGGGVAEYQRFVDAFGRVCADNDGDGRGNVSFNNLFVLSAEQIAEIESDPEHELGYALLKSDAETLKDRLIYSEYYLCILSKEVYDEYKVIDGIPLFLPLAGYLPEGSEAVLYDEGAVELSSLEFGKIPVMLGLDGAVVCLRTKSAFADHFNKKQNEKNFANCEQLLRNILTYGE